MNCRNLFLSASALVIALSARADVLELKSGKVLQGTYVGGTAGTIRFETGSGLQVIETSQALALTFTSGSTAATSGSAAPATASAPAPAAAPASVMVPAGSTLLVRMVDSVSSNDPQGKRFTTKLETDLVASGTVVAKAGTKVYGRIQSVTKARRYSGQSSLDLRLSEIASGPNLVPVLTSAHAQASEKSIKKTAGGAAVGAAIGAISDGGDGAAKGAAIGAVASGLKRGQTVSVPSGTLLEFKLQQPVSLTAAP